MSVPFVGRRSELAKIAALVGRSDLDRAPSAALVTGEPGSGKTRLLDEVFAATRPSRLVRVVGFEPNQFVPLAAVGEVIRHLSKVPVHGPNLEELVFGDHHRTTRAPLRIFEAAHRAVSIHGPLVIGVDDLQWVDDQSLGLIHYLLRAAGPARQSLGVVAAARPSRAATEFRATLEGAIPAGRRAVIELGPLPLEDGLSLARSIDANLNATTAAALWRRARGSPFWLDALARSGGDVEPSALIAERLRSLGRDAGALLAAMAVGARPFAANEIAELLEWDPNRVAHASAELHARGLGVEAGGTIRMAHDLIREAVTTSLPVSARRRLHGRFAEWIAETAGDDVALLREALDHRLAAGQAPAELARRLVSSPGRRLLGSDDLQMLAGIADALESSDPARDRLDRSLGELAAILGAQDLALERWSRASESSLDGSDRQRSELEAARAAYRLGRRTDGHAHISRARAAWPTEGETAIELDALEAEIELWLDHETAAGARSAARALAGARTLADAVGGLHRLGPEGRRAYLAALVVVGDAALQEDRAEEVSLYSDTILLVAEGLDDETQVGALIRTGFALRPLGRVAESVTHYQKAWDVAKRLVLPTLTVEAGHGLARGLRDMGRLAEAHAVATETGELELRIRNAPRRWGSADSIAHAIELSLGDPARALRALRNDAENEPDPHYRLAIHETAAAWQARFAGPAAAADVEAGLETAREDSALARCPRCAAELAIVSAELLARIGRVDEARDVFGAWDRGPGRPYLQRELWRLRATAAIASAEGDDGRAVSILEAYAAELARAGLMSDLLWAWIDLGRTHARVDRGRAVAALTDAAELADRIGAASQGRLVAQGLRRLGVRAWRRGSSTPGAGLAGLSEREREIAARVADGSSNREIAETLVVSPKTVERHVTNVLAKLGLRNRTELASLIRAESVRGLPDE